MKSKKAKNECTFSDFLFVLALIPQHYYKIFFLST